MYRSSWYVYKHLNIKPHRSCHFFHIRESVKAGVFGVTFNSMGHFLVHCFKQVCLSTGFFLTAVYYNSNLVGSNIQVRVTYCLFSDQHDFNDLSLQCLCSVLKLCRFYMTSCLTWLGRFSKFSWIYKMKCFQNCLFCFSDGFVFFLTRIFSF